MHNLFNDAPAYTGADIADMPAKGTLGAEFFAQGVGWVPVDPGDVRKVVLEEPPANLKIDHPMVVAARKRLFGGWEMNWLAYNMAHDVALPNSNGPKIPYFMYTNGETGGKALDQLEPDGFKYEIRTVGVKGQSGVKS